MTGLRSGLGRLPFLPLAAVAAYGLLLGLFAWNAYVEPVVAPHRLEWRAPWIAYPGGLTSQSYFRKNLFLPAAPRHAWIQITAPDQYALYVNNHAITPDPLVLRNLTAVHDITPWLTPGTNMIAVAAYRLSYPGTSQVAVQGEYEDWHGNRWPIDSGASWKVAPYWERQLGGDPQWFEVRYEDVAWRTAEVRGPPTPGDQTRVPYHPWVYRERPEGRWIWSPVATAEKSHFRYRLDLPSGASEAWIRVATQGGYRLLVNGVEVAERQEPLPSGAQTTTLKMQMYDITPFLRTGTNVLGLAAQSRRAARRIYVDGLIVDGAGREQPVMGSPAWASSVSPSTDWPLPGHEARGWAPSAALGSLSPDDGPVIKELRPTAPSQLYLALRRVKWVGLLTAGVVGAVGLWAIWAALCVRFRRHEVDRARLNGTIPFAAAATVLLAALLLSYDIRFDPTLPFRSLTLLASLGVLLGSQALIALWPAAAVASENGPERPPAPNTRWAVAARGIAARRHVVLLAALVLAGFLVRLHHVDYEPLNSDEATSMLSVAGILDSGFPRHRLTDLVDIRVSHSSELVGYPKALAAWLFGLTDFAGRLPAVVFGALSILAIYLLGQTLFDRRVAAAAVVFTVLPAFINYSQHARYPAQLQLLAIVTACLFYRAIRVTPAAPRLLYWAVAVFGLMYLSWEGGAVLLSGLFVGLLAVRRSFGWLKEKHLWLALIPIALLVFFQQSYRIIDQATRMSLTTGYADVALVPLWLYPQYDPLVFFHNLLFLKNVQVISLGALLGLVVGLRERPFAYLNALWVTPLFLITNLLEAQEFRHVYYMAPFAVLSGVRGVFWLLDRLLPLPAIPPGDRLPRAMTRILRGAVVTLVLLTASDYVLKLYNMPGYYEKDVYLGVGSDGWIRSAAAFVRERRSPGEPVIVRQPNWVYYYLGAADYLLRTQDIPAAVSDRAPIPVDSKSGTRTNTDLNELLQVLHGARSAWIIAGRQWKDVDRPVVTFIQQNTRLVFEDAGIQVYRWQR